MGTLKAMFFGVDRGNGLAVDSAFMVLLPEMRYGRTLFIELTRRQVENALRGGEGKSESVKRYQRLVRAAHRMGMRVVALDSEGMLGLAFRERAKRHRDARHSRLAFKYVFSRLRERRFKLVLREAQEGDIVVMHPLRLQRLQIDLGIPDAQCRYFAFVQGARFDSLLPEEERLLKELREREKRRGLLTVKERSQEARKRRLGGR